MCQHPSLLQPAQPICGAQTPSDEATNRDRPDGHRQLGVARADEALKAVLAGPSVRRVCGADVWRHPYETLSFFGIRRHDCGGDQPRRRLYTEILAPYLRDRGLLILAGDDPESGSAYYRRSAERLRLKLKANPATYDRVQQTVFEPPHRVRIAAAARSIWC